MAAVVTQDSPNDIRGLMSFNWEEILTCRPNCIWLKTILVLLLANWLGWVDEVFGGGGLQRDRWCPCGNILNVLQMVMKRRNKSLRGGRASWRNTGHDVSALCEELRRGRRDKTNGIEGWELTVCLITAASEYTLCERQRMKRRWLHYTHTQYLGS